MSRFYTNVTIRGDKFSIADMRMAKEWRVVEMIC